MKKYLTMLVVMCIMLCGITVNAKSVLSDGSSITVTETNDLENGVDDIIYNTVPMSNNGVLVPFTLTAPSKVRLAVNTGTCKMVDSKDEDGELQDVSLDIYLFSDQQRMRQLGESQRVSTADNGMVSDMSELYYLEAGTYYLQLGDLDNDARYLTGELQVGVLSQGLTSCNKKSGATKAEANALKFNKVYADCTTMKNTYDWYSLDLAHDAYVTFVYSAEKNGEIIIYDESGLEIDSFTRSTEGEVKDYEIFLTQGKYYIQFGDDEASGNTTLKLTRVWHYLGLTEVMESGIDYLKITSIDFSKIVEFLMVKTKVTNKSSELWDTKSTSMKITTKKYRPLKNGWYSFRIKDEDGNYLINTIKIKNVDTKAPSKPKVTYRKGNLIEGKAEAKAKVYVKIKNKTYSVRVASDKTFGIVLKKKYKKGTKFTICVKDRSGNKTKTYTFKMK